MPLTDLPDNPLDHNAECRFCDEQAGHAADCPWLEARLKELADYQSSFALYYKASMALMDAYKATHPATPDLVWPDATAVNLWAAGELQHLRERLTAKDEEPLKANEKVERNREAATDYAAKVQFLINWADSRGLLEEHVFTFPDGDTWEAKRPESPPPLQRPLNEQEQRILKLKREGKL